MLNKVQIIGNLGRDPELRDAAGTPVASFSVAASERWKGKDGDKQEHTEWFNVVAWRGLGETAAQYLRKGSKVYVEGKLRTRKWQDKDGGDRYTSEVVASNVVFLDPKGTKSSSGSDRDPPPVSDDDIPF